MLSITSPTSYYPDLDSILDRHDPSVTYTPLHYPDWADEEWKRVYREHTDQLQTRWIRGVREQHLTQHIQSEKRKKIIMLLELLRGPVCIGITDRVHRLHQSTQEDLKMKAILHSRDRSKITQQALNNEDRLRRIISEDPNGKNLCIYLLWATRLSRSQEKGKGKKYNQQMVSLLEQVLKEIGVDIGIQPIQIYIQTLPPETIQGLIRDISRSVHTR